MTTLHGKSISLLALAASMLGSALSGCGLMHDDLAECAVKPNTTTSVKFVYDYNTQATDLFSDNVGAVTVFVFDKDGKYLFEQEFDRRFTLRPDFSVAFDTTKIVPGNSYRFTAVARGNHLGYDGAQQRPGATFRRTSFPTTTPGKADGATPSTLADFNIIIDRNSGSVPHAGVMLDTLWTSRAPQTLTVPPAITPKEGALQEPDRHLSVTVPLMRITNHLTISFWQTDFPTKIDLSHYEIYIEVPDGKGGKLDHAGEPVADEAITYTPFKTWTANTTVDGANAACIYAEFGLSRLMVDSSTRLVIRNKNTGMVHRLDYLAKILANGRDAWQPVNWSQQEYLDREHEFSIDFPLGDAIPKWVQVNVNILSWSKRVNLVEL